MVVTLLAAWVTTTQAQPLSAEPPSLVAPSPASPPYPLPARALPAATPPAAAHAASPSAPAQGTEATLQDAVRAALSHWGCLPSDLLAYQQRWYAACGADGVFVVERREDDVLVLAERRSVPGRAQSLFVREEVVWVESTRIEAHPLGEFVASAATAGSTSSAPLAVPAERPTRPVYVSAPAGSLRRDAASASQRGATYSKLAPPRVGRLLTVEGGIRPYLPMRSLGVALLADATVTYHGERAWYVQAQLFPLGATATKDTDASVFGFAASVGYDHPYFAVGLGVGALRRGQFHFDFDPIQRRDREWIEHSFGFSITQSLRVGALDGLSLTVANAFVLDSERWRYGYFDLTIQVPLNRQTWLTAGGGGAEEAGFLYAEVGLRRLVRGDLGSGSLFVEPSVGLAGIDNRIEGVGPGPMVGCHLEWRK
ncbi:MAG: hypothetical protein RLZZ450_5836 [Pseudomonadota bacterium]